MVCIISSDNNFEVNINSQHFKIKPWVCSLYDLKKNSKQNSNERKVFCRIRIRNSSNKSRLFYFYTSFVHAFVFAELKRQKSSLCALPDFKIHSVLLVANTYTNFHICNICKIVLLPIQFVFSLTMVVHRHAAVGDVVLSFGGRPGPVAGVDAAVVGAARPVGGARTAAQQEETLVFILRCQGN